MKKPIHRPFWKMITYKKATMTFPLEVVSSIDCQDQLEAFETYKKAEKKGFSFQFQIWFQNNCIWSGDPKSSF